MKKILTIMVSQMKSMMLYIQQKKMYADMKKLMMNTTASHTKKSTTN